MPLSARSRFAATALVAGSLAVAAPTASFAAHKAPTSTATTTASAAPVTATSPLRIIASPATVYSTSGAPFAVDAPYAVGGSLTTTPAVVARTASAQLYQYSRVGVGGYDIPVSAPGTYFVDLFVSETAGAAAGQRVWNVTGEGRTLASGVDVARYAGQNTAWHVLASVAVTDGVLNLRFPAVVGKVAINAVEVDYQKAATTTSTLLSEDFNGAAGAPANGAVWNYDTGANANSLQTYTDRTSNAALDGAGNLAITARQETYTGTDGQTRNYTSAQLESLGKFSFQYGQAEARIKVPAGAGLWPAFWAEGTNVNTSGWPLCGEIDVMENLGQEPTVVHQTLHAATNTASNWSLGLAANTGVTLADDYHNYGVTWGPSAISMQFDGHTYFATSVWDQLNGNSWNFGHPFFLLLDLAVGGWAGNPPATTAFPAVMSVDYVHVTG